MDEKRTFELIKSGKNYYHLPLNIQRGLGDFCYERYTYYRKEERDKDILKDDFLHLFDKGYKTLQDKVISGEFKLDGKASIRHFLWLMIRGHEMNRAKKMKTRERLEKALLDITFANNDELLKQKAIEVMWTVIKKHSSQKCIELLKIFFPDLNEKKPTHKEYIKTAFPNLSEVKREKGVNNLKKAISRCKKNLRTSVVANAEYQGTMNSLNNWDFA